MDITKLNHDYTSLLASIISNFIVRHKIENLDAIYSHDHTIVHQPEKEITLQIGNLKELSNLIQQTVVCGFRIKDINLGRQGTPLVPYSRPHLIS